MANKSNCEPTFEELCVELGLDELTYERCVEGLFGELGLAEALLGKDPTRPRYRRRQRRPRWKPEPPDEAELRVVQTGPGRRHEPHGPKAEDKET